MKHIHSTALLALAGILGGCHPSADIEAVVATQPKTFCNPLNLDYRFMLIDGGEGIREAADPVVVRFKDQYLLFASKSSGYWVTPDFVTWHHVVIPDSVLPVEDYAPAVMVHDGWVYYVGSTHGKGMVYRSDCPEEGRWEPVRMIDSFWDPAFLVDGDKLYLYYGCSPADPIHARRLDLQTLENVSEVVDCLNSDKESHGWERTGEHNELERRPYIEGAWMTEHDGMYYLQYAAPGTEWKTYADGLYTSTSPMGPFRYHMASPVSAKPAGFMSGAGHGCLFQAGDQWWKAATNAISVRHMFERRLSFYPSAFDADGQLYTDTYLGDYPHFLPGTENAAQDGGPVWMLLSCNRPVQASSSLEDQPATNAVDEESRTSWVAQGNGAEWLQVDLMDECDIQAIQVNYDEYGATARGMADSLYQQYRLYASHDGRRWSLIADRSDKYTDTPHDYVEFERPFSARYIKWENVAYTLSSNVSLRDLRVFGLGRGRVPSVPRGLRAERNPEDRCQATLTWQPARGAEGYVVRYGIAPDKLYSSHQVLEGHELRLTGLNAEPVYWFAVDAYNASGIIHGTETISME